MKKYLCALFISLYTFLGAVDNSQNETWALFIKKCENEQFMVRFPFDPTVNATKNFVLLTSEDGGVKYSLIRKNVENSSFDYETVVKVILEELKCSQIISSSVKKDVDKVIVQLEYKKESENYKVTAFILPKSFYILSTTFKDSNLEKHKYFADSFVLEEGKNKL